MASSFLIKDILRRECEKSLTGNILNDFFYFLKLIEGSIRRLDANQSNQTTYHLFLREVKKRSAGLKTSPALYLPFISYEHPCK